MPIKRKIQHLSIGDAVANAHVRSALELVAAIANPKHYGVRATNSGMVKTALACVS